MSITFNLCKGKLTVSLVFISPLEYSLTSGFLFPPRVSFCDFIFFNPNFNCSALFWHPSSVVWPGVCSLYSPFLCLKCQWNISSCLQFLGCVPLIFFWTANLFYTFSSYKPFEKILLSNSLIFMLLFFFCPYLCTLIEGSWSCNVMFTYPQVICLFDGLRVLSFWVK